MRNCKYFILYITFSLVSFILNGQSSNSDKIVYNAPGIYIVSKNPAGVELARKPIGRNVMITYDKFFKSYEILYEDENENLVRSYLEYLSEETVDKKVKMIRTRDTHGNIIMVVDLLAEIGKFQMLVNKEYKDVIPWIIIEKAIHK